MTDSLIQPNPGDNDLNNEPWVSKEEIKKMFKVSDRTLTYWRGSGKIQYKNIRNRTYYLASEVRVMVEKQNRPKTYLGIRKSTIERKLRKIDVVLGIAIIVSLFWFVTLPLKSKDPYTIKDVSLGFKVILFNCALYGVVRLIMYIWKKIFRKSKPEE